MWHAFPFILKKKEKNEFLWNSVLCILLYYTAFPQKEEKKSSIVFRKKIAAGVISLLISVEMSRKGNCFAPVTANSYIHFKQFFSSINFSSTLLSCFALNNK